MQPASLANIFWAAASLQLALPEPLLQELLLEVQVKMPAFDGLTMPKLAWALCVLGIKPGASWLRDFSTFTLKVSLGQRLGCSCSAAPPTELVLGRRSSCMCTGLQGYCCGTGWCSIAWHATLQALATCHLCIIFA
jgi:hypothetical protein